MLERITRLFRGDEVPETRSAAAEADPREVGMTREAVEEIWAAVRAFQGTGLSPAISMSLVRDGKTLIERAVGWASGRGPGDSRSDAAIPATPDTLFPIFSASKAVTALLVHILDERRLIHLDDPVCEYLPAFGRNGKHTITIRHVLTHRAGIPSIPGPEVNLDILASEDRVFELLCEARPTWRAGRTLAYHALTGGFVLGALVRAVTGRPIQEFLAEAIREPLGLKSLRYGALPEQVPLLARSYETGFGIPFPFSLLVKRALGVSFGDAVRFANDPRFLTSVVPAGNIVATARDVTRLYRALLEGGTLDGARIMDPKTIRRAVSEQSYLELDLTLGLPVRYGLGLMLGDHGPLGMFGPDTPRAYGHLGFTTVFSWADPERRLAAAILTSGKPTVHPGLLKLGRVLRAISSLCPRDGQVRFMNK